MVSGCAIQRVDSYICRWEPNSSLPNGKHQSRANVRPQVRLWHLLPGFGSSERCPQLGGCRPLPRSESSIERIRILVAEQKCHFRDIHLRAVEVLVRQFLPRLKKQLPEGCAVIDDSTLQGPIA